MTSTFNKSFLNPILLICIYNVSFRPKCCICQNIRVIHQGNTSLIVLVSMCSTLSLWSNVFTYHYVSLSGLGVTCSSRDPRDAGSKRSIDFSKVLLPSHLISCTPTRSILYFSISLVTELRAPSLCRLLTIQVPEHMSIFLPLSLPRPCVMNKYVFTV